MPEKVQYWLVKTEPESFSIDDLAACPQQTTCWSGVRNYQARNYMRDDMQVGDQVLFHHSNAEPPAIVGAAEVVRAGYPDHTSWDANDSHYDPGSTPLQPRWSMVDLKFVCKFVAPLGLPDLRDVAALKNMELLRKGSRLSVQPVTKAEFAAVLKLAKK